MACSEVGIVSSDPSSSDNVSFTGCVLLSAPSPGERRDRLRVLRADLTPCWLSAALLSVEPAFRNSQSDEACMSFRLRPTWVRVSPCVDSLAVCHATRRISASIRSGTTRVSQVLVASLHAYHALRWTPADPRRPHQVGPSVLASGTLTPSPSASNALTGLFQA